MKKLKRPYLSLLLVCLLPTVLFLWTNGTKSDDIYSKIGKNLTVLGDIYKEVTKNYVDKIDPDKFLKAGIDGMLNTLDPYSAYIEREDRHQLQILTHGKYGGVGMPLNYRNNAVTVVDPPFLGTPAARAGIREGDTIIEVDGASTKNLGLDETARRIRGPVGSEVTLTIRREGELKLLDFTLVREQIKVEDVRYSGTIDDGIGYIRLTRFSKNAESEVADAIRSFKTQNLKGLILDLRSNPGGMLEAAVDISDLFLPKDVVIVSTRGRTKSSIREEKSKNTPTYGEGPLVVLVNRISASASEIVAGAIQDHDRGLVMGDTTFGKGLVQSVVPLSPSAALKITTAKYYTPSGRCIQKRHYSTWNDTTTGNDSLAYHTDHGREVKGGGGITPDVTVPLPRVNDIVWDLRRKSLFFNFAVHYANTHAALDSDFLVDNKILEEFYKYIQEKSFEYKHPIENRLAALKTESLEAGYGSSILQDISHLEKSLNRIKEDMLQSSKKDVQRLLKLELASKFFGVRRGVEMGLEDDLVVQKALSFLNDRELYDSILKN